MPTPTEIKKALLDAGFEVYRTRPDVVHVAERVRENLMMDSGVYVDTTLIVGFVTRAQHTDFPNDSDETLFERARELGRLGAPLGYAETSAEIRNVVDPGDANHVIDRWCEVSYVLRVSDLEAAMAAVKYALTLEKAAVPR